jgi:hypothetical protein
MQFLAFIITQPQIRMQAIFIFLLTKHLKYVFYLYSAFVSLYSKLTLHNNKKTASQKT